MVAEWSERTPDTPAVSVAGTGESVSYRELWARSGQLAVDLVAAGVGRGDTAGKPRVSTGPSPAAD